MKLLALDTSTEACSAALLLDGETRERFELAPQRHAELILRMVDELLNEAGLAPAALDAFAFGRGPGAFTGVRIGTAVVQGLAFAADRPVVPVSTLAALAQGALREQGHRRVLALIDARMGEVYWGAFQADADGIMHSVGPEQVSPPADVSVADGAWYGVGTGWSADLAARMSASVTGFDAARYPHAADVALLGKTGLERGQGVAPELALPVYLRDKVVGR